jgi:hypothetical protein
MAKIIPFGGITKLDLDPDLILENNKGEFEGLVLIGWAKDGSERFISTYGDGGTVLWLLERCKQRLIRNKEE